WSCLRRGLFTLNSLLLLSLTMTASPICLRVRCLLALDSLLLLNLRAPTTTISLWIWLRLNLRRLYRPRSFHVSRTIPLLNHTRLLLALRLRLLFANRHRRSNNFRITSLPNRCRRTLTHFFRSCGRLSNALTLGLLLTSGGPFGLSLTHRIFNLTLILVLIHSPFKIRAST